MKFDTDVQNDKVTGKPRFENIEISQPNVVCGQILADEALLTTKPNQTNQPTNGLVPSQSQ